MYDIWEVKKMIHQYLYFFCLKASYLQIKKPSNTVKSTFDTSRVQGSVKMIDLLFGRLMYVYIRIFF